MRLDEINPIAQIQVTETTLDTLEDKGAYFIIRKWNSTRGGWRESNPAFVLPYTAIRWLRDELDKVLEKDKK